MIGSAGNLSARSISYRDRMDVLSRVLELSGVRGSAGACFHASGTWGFARPAAEQATLYAVTTGSAWLTAAGEQPVLVRAGDVVLLPTGVAHAVSSAPGAVAPVCDGAAVRQAQDAGTPVHVGDGAAMRLVGASYTHDPADSASVFAMLPAVLHVPAEQADPGAAAMVGAVARELGDPGAPAAAYALNRLIDLLLVQVLRTWLATAPVVDAAWWGVLRDPVLLAVVTRMHERPDLPWTTATLAGTAAVSKTTLNRRFLAATGTNPVAYLTRWRMNVAANRLRESDEPVERIARAVGYRSVYAFTRAFHRERGQPPARFRQHSRARQAALLTTHDACRGMHPGPSAPR